ncbi:hypothetical protein C0J52_26019 [Blattella germanica]|nr:hypothetical protein C0J52_26019 [Blattella germanica]
MEVLEIWKSQLLFLCSCVLNQVFNLEFHESPGHGPLGGSSADQFMTGLTVTLLDWNSAKSSQNN